MKKQVKRQILIVVIGIIVISLLGVGYSYWKKVENNKLELRKITKIKKNYAKVVSPTKDKEIYRKEKDRYQKIGVVHKGIALELDSIEIKSSNDVYFPIKNSDYYIEYHDLKTEKSIDFDTSLDSYLVKKEITTVPTILYKDNNIAFRLEEEHTFDVLAIEQDKYYVKFLNQIYIIKDHFKLVDKNSDISKLEKISVINFSDDISDSKLEEVLRYLQENHYDSISISDFKLWVNGSVYLTDKKVLLITYGELTETRKEILNRYSMTVENHLDTISFTSGDQQIQVGDSKYYKYEVFSNTSINRVKDMLNGIPKIEIANQKIAVLNYHFFYDSQKEACNESICISTENFKKQLSYLKENQYKVLTMSEFNDWMDGKIEIPKKSVLITIDDGAMGTFDYLPQILNEYQMPATLFLISSWWPISRYQGSSYLEIQSHGHDLHHNDYCDSSGCGYKTLKLSKEDLKADLKTSVDTIGSHLAFCYPFYQTNSTLVEAVKESGFQLGFVGGNKKASRTSNKYYIPRYVIYKNTSMSSFIQMISE